MRSALADLQVTELTVHFGGLAALTEVDLTVPAGRVTGLIGPNGAGKTTLFNAVTGLVKPKMGRVRLDGRDITRLRPHQRARLGVIRTFQRIELFGSLSAHENVQVAMERHRGGQHEAPLRSAGDLLAWVGLSEVADQPADLLPTGQARLLELARALAASPRVLLLDEPASGLSESETSELASVLRQLSSDGLGVLLVEHDMSLVMSVCAEVSVLEFGRIIAAGDPSTVQEHPAVQLAYLGSPGAPPEASPVSDSSAELGVTAPSVSSNGPAPPAVSDGSAGPDGRADEAVEDAITVTNLSASYGRIEVVHDVSFSVPRGSVFALVGPNGAGKSTLLKVLSGCKAPAAGRVVVDGVEITKPIAQRLARRKVCTLPEGRAIFPNLTVRENLRMFTFRGRDVRLAAVEEQSYEQFPVLKERSGQLAGRLSGGEQQMLAICRALATQPDVLFLDELSMGLAPTIVAQLYGVLADLGSRRQLTIVVVEQFASLALQVAHRAGVMIGGRLVHVGQPDEIGDVLVSTYLGSKGVP
jgi:ABC-type branched-subunit amino acid transport system ATPase component